MIDIKDIVSMDCDECGIPLGMEVGFQYTIMDRDEVFSSYECAEQFVINHNVDETERKGER